MPNAGLRAQVAPIASTPSPHGLLGGCVEIVNANDIHQLNGTDLPAYACAPANPWQDCPDPADGWTNPAAKVVSRAEWCTFEPVTAYAKVECSVVGFPFDEAQASAREQVRLGEQAVLEEWFMRRGLSWLAFGNDLTPGSGALHLVSGIGVLESWLATEYGGQGLIHVPVGAASLMGKHHQFDPAYDCLTTWGGNKVILGGGYTANVGPALRPAAGVVAPAGEMWLYATPAMRIRRDAIIDVIDQEWQGVNTSLNDRTALAESTFVPEVDCCKAAAVRVTLSPCCA
jgi:hypothetical protein